MRSHITFPRMATLAVLAALTLLPTATATAGGGLSTLPSETVKGSKAKLVDGRAIAPADAPRRVQRVIAAANRIRNKPYKWGGGHGSWKDKGYDCSGAVSYALHGGGLLGTPLDSTGLSRYGSRGKGDWISVYGNPGHAYMIVAGLRFDTSNPKIHRQTTDATKFLAQTDAIFNGICDVIMRLLRLCFLGLWIYCGFSLDHNILGHSLYANPPQVQPKPRREFPPADGKKDHRQTADQDSATVSRKNAVARVEGQSQRSTAKSSSKDHWLALRSWIDRSYPQHPAEHLSQIQALLQQPMSWVEYTKDLSVYLRRKNWQVRQKAAYTFSLLPNFIQDVAVLSTLRWMSRHDAHWRVRQEALRALGNTATQHRQMVLPAVLYGLQKDTYWQVRDQAAKTLGQLGVDKLPANTDLQEVLNDAAWQVRSSMAHTFQQLGGTVLKPAWIRALGLRLLDPEPAVQYAASQALSRLGSAGLVVLLEVIQGPHRQAQLHAIRALRSHPQNSPETERIVLMLRKILRGMDTEVVQEATATLSHLGVAAAPAVAELVGLFSHSHVSVRLMASWALQQIGVTALPALAQKLYHSHASVKMLAAETIGLLGYRALQAPKPHIEKAVSALVDTLLDPLWTVRREAAWALYRLGPKAARFVHLGLIPALMVAVQDKQWSVRYGIVRVLGWMGSRGRMIVGWFGPRQVSTVGILQQLTKHDPDSRVRRAAREALIRVQILP